MNKAVTVTLLACIGAAALMQAWAGILIGQRLTEVMLNNEEGTASRPVAAFECTSWSMREGKTSHYELMENGATGCPVPAFWEVL